jgi:hypothetical protein
MSIDNVESRMAKLESRARQQDEIITALQKKVVEFQDIEDIKRLQKAYGYYLEFWMWDEVIDCFSDSPEVTLKLYEGTYIGKESIRRYFERNRQTNPEKLHQVMQISGIVHVDSDAKTGQGRWYSFGANTMPQEDGVRQYFMNGIYEDEYIKEKGVWKFSRVEYSMTYAAAPDTGWVSADRVTKNRPRGGIQRPAPDIPPEEYETRYPSGYIFPFHYVHPVTGKPTVEKQRNASLKPMKRMI